VDVEASCESSRARATARHAAVVAEATGRVFARHPELPDHRRQRPWLTGWLGDPQAAVWFVAARQRADGRAAPPLAQALRAAGFTDGGPLTPGGWRCYLTNVVKSVDEATSAEPPSAVEARIWAPVLAAQLADGRPALLVTLGRQACELLEGIAHLIPGLPPRWLAGDTPDVAALAAVRRQSLRRSPSRATAASK